MECIAGKTSSYTLQRLSEDSSLVRYFWLKYSIQYIKPLNKPLTFIYQTSYLNTMTDEMMAVAEKKDDEATSITGTLDESCITLLKNGKPTNRGKLDYSTICAISEQISHGISMNTACLYAGIPPTTGYLWFKKGQEEVENLTDEEILSCPDGIEGLVGLYGKFYLKASKARANCVVEIHDMLYERAFESGKEWIATYLLERQEPEKYNLKYKVQQEVNANVTANVVEFKFVDGVSQRPVDEADFINEQVEALRKKYSDHDIIIDADQEIVEEKETKE